MKAVLPSMFLATVAMAAEPTTPPAPPTGYEAKRNIYYADTTNIEQSLDLYLPTAPFVRPRPLLIWVHGGGWGWGEKNGNVDRALRLARNGDLIIAAVGYRLSTHTPWPAQIHDLKAAVRWLRANARVCNIDPDRIGAFGESAGGHLVAALGTMGGVKEIEGTLGSHTNVSSRVNCVIDDAGPTDFLTAGDRLSVNDYRTKTGIAGKLLGGAPADIPEVARMASPVAHVTPDDPPFLIEHSMQDANVPYSQSLELRDALKKAGVPVFFMTRTPLGGHCCGDADLERTFVEKFLLKRDVNVPEQSEKPGGMNPEQFDPLAADILRIVNRPLDLIAVPLANNMNIAFALARYNPTKSKEGAKRKPLVMAVAPDERLAELQQQDADWFGIPLSIHAVALDGRAKGNADLVVMEPTAAELAALTPEDLNRLLKPSSGEALLTGRDKIALAAWAEGNHAKVVEVNRRTWIRHRPASPATQKGKI